MGGRRHRAPLHVDDATRATGKTWIHVCAGGPITVKGLHRNRGCEAINTLGIIPRYGGLIVHDCWKAYLTYTQCKHQLCGAHLRRELQAVTDSNAYPWARKMRLLLIARRQVIQRPQQRLSMRHYKRIARCYKAILEQGRSEMPQIPREKRASADRSRSPTPITCTHASSSRKERPALYQAPILPSLTPSAISAWPRSSRRSPDFRTVSFAHAYCRISSYLQWRTRLQPTGRHHIVHGNAVDCLNQDNE